MKSASLAVKSCQNGVESCFCIVPEILLLGVLFLPRAGWNQLSCLVCLCLCGFAERGSVKDRSGDGRETYQGAFTLWCLQWKHFLFWQFQMLKVQHFAVINIAEGLFNDWFHLPKFWS